VESPHGNSLTILLTELVRHGSGPRTVKSGLTIRELYLCSIFTDLVFVKSFLQSNAKSLRSFSVRNVQVTDLNKEVNAQLTPAHVGRFDNRKRKEAC
jgi:hypothetical protein